jgi:hypothetical protein
MSESRNKKEPVVKQQTLSAAWDSKIAEQDQMPAATIYKKWMQNPGVVKDSNDTLAALESFLESLQTMSLDDAISSYESMLPTVPRKIEESKSSFYEQPTLTREKILSLQYSLAYEAYFFTNHNIEAFNILKEMMFPENFPLIRGHLIKSVMTRISDLIRRRGHNHHAIEKSHIFKAFMHIYYDEREDAESGYKELFLILQKKNIHIEYMFSYIIRYAVSLIPEKLDTLNLLFKSILKENEFEFFQFEMNLSNYSVKILTLQCSGFFRQSLPYIKEYEKKIEANQYIEAVYKKNRLLEINLDRFVAHLCQTPPDLKNAEHDFQNLEKNCHNTSDLNRHIQEIISNVIRTHRKIRKASEQFTGRWLERPRTFYNFFLKQPKINEYNLYLCFKFLIEESMLSQQEEVVKTVLEETFQRFKEKTHKADFIVKLICNHFADVDAYNVEWYKKYLEYTDLFINVLKSSTILPVEYLRSAYLKFGVMRLLSQDDLSLVLEFFKKAEVEPSCMLSTYKAIIEIVFFINPHENSIQRLHFILNSMKPKDELEEREYHHVLEYFKRKNESVSKASVPVSRGEYNENKSEKDIPIRIIHLENMNESNDLKLELDIAHLHSSLIQSKESKNDVNMLTFSDELIKKIEKYPYHFTGKNEKLLEAYLLRCVARFKLSSDEEDILGITKEDFIKMEKIEVKKTKQELLHELINLALTEDYVEAYMSNQLDKIARVISIAKNLIQFLDVDNEILILKVAFLLVEINIFSGKLWDAEVLLIGALDRTRSSLQGGRINEIIKMIMRQDQYKKTYLFGFAPSAFKMISRVARQHKKLMINHYITLCVDLMHLQSEERELKQASGCVTEALNFAGKEAKMVCEKIISQYWDHYGEETTYADNVRLRNLLCLIKADDANATAKINREILSLNKIIKLRKLGKKPAVLPSKKYIELKPTPDLIQKNDVRAIDVASEKKAKLIQKLQIQKDAISAQLSEIQLFKIEAPLLNQNTQDVLEAFLKENQKTIGSFEKKVLKIKEDKQLKYLLEDLKRESLDEYQYWDHDFQSLFNALDKAEDLLKEKFHHVKKSIDLHLEGTQIIIQECKILAQLMPDEFNLTAEFKRSIDNYSAISQFLKHLQNHPSREMLDAKSQELDTLEKGFKEFPKKISAMIDDLGSKLKEMNRSKDAQKYRKELKARIDVLKGYKKQIECYLDEENIDSIAGTRDFISNLSETIQVSKAHHLKHKKKKVARVKKQRKLTVGLNDFLSTTSDKIAEFKKTLQSLMEGMKAEVILNQSQYNADSAMKIIKNIEMHMKSLQVALGECSKEFIERYTEFAKMNHDKSIEISDALSEQQVLKEMDLLKEKINIYLLADSYHASVDEFSIKENNSIRENKVKNSDVECRIFFKNLSEKVLNKISENNVENREVDHRRLCQKHIDNVNLRCQKIINEIKVFSEEKTMNGFKKYHNMLALIERFNSTTLRDMSNELHNAKREFSQMREASEYLQKVFGIPKDETREQAFITNIHAANEILDKAKGSFDELTLKCTNIYGKSVYQLASDKHVLPHLSYLLQIKESLDEKVSVEEVKTSSEKKSSRGLLKKISFSELFASLKRKESLEKKISLEKKSSEGSSLPKIIRVGGSFATALHLLELGFPKTAAEFLVNDIDLWIYAPHFGKLADTFIDNTCPKLGLTVKKIERTLYYVSIKIGVPESGFLTEIHFANMGFYKTKSTSHLGSHMAFFTDKPDSPLKIDKTHPHYEASKRACLGNEFHIKYTPEHTNYLWRLFKVHRQFKRIKILLEKEAKNVTQKALLEKAKEAKNEPDELRYLEALHDAMNQFRILIQNGKHTPHYHCIGLLKNVSELKNKIQNDFSIKSEQVNRLLDDIDNDLKPFLTEYFSILLDKALENIPIRKSINIAAIIEDMIPHIEVIFEMIKPLLEKPFEHNASKKLNGKQIAVIFPYFIEKILDLKLSSSNALTPQIIQSWKEDLYDNVKFAKTEKDMSEFKEEESHLSEEDHIELSELFIPVFFESPLDSDSAHAFPLTKKSEIKSLPLDSQLSRHVVSAALPKDSQHHVIHPSFAIHSQESKPVSVQPVSAISHPLPLRTFEQYAHFLCATGHQPVFPSHHHFANTFFGQRAFRSQSQAVAEVRPPPFQPRLPLRGVLPRLSFVGSHSSAIEERVPEIPRNHSRRNTR